MRGDAESSGISSGYRPQSSRATKTRLTRSRRRWAMTSLVSHAGRSVVLCLTPLPIPSPLVLGTLPFPRRGPRQDGADASASPPRNSVTVCASLSPPRRVRAAEGRRSAPPILRVPHSGLSLYVTVSVHESHLAADGSLDLGVPTPIDLDSAVPRARLWCNAYSLRRETSDALH